MEKDPHARRIEQGKGMTRMRYWMVMHPCGKARLSDGRKAMLRSWSHKVERDDN